jgi:uncharacterized membrane protein
MIFKQIAIVFAYGLLSIVVTIFVNKSVHLFMIWNLLLSFFVFLLAYGLKSDWVQSKSNLLFIIYGFVWLFFLPNTFYFMTDILHVTTYNFYVQDGYMSIAFIEDLKMYVALFHLLIGMAISLYYGCYSVFAFKDELVSRYRISISNVFFGVVAFLSSVGIVIGRFFRLNSWDILRPFKLLSTVIDNWNLFTTTLVGILFVVHIVLLVGYNALVEGGGKNG